MDDASESGSAPRRATTTAADPTTALGASAPPPGALTVWPQTPRPPAEPGRGSVVASAFEAVASAVLVVAPAAVLGSSTTYVSRATALSIVLGAGQLLRLRREVGSVARRASELDTPLVAVAVLTAALVHGPAAAPTVLGVQALTLALAWSGWLAPMEAVSTLAHRALTAAVDRLRDVVFLLLGLFTLVMPWVVQRLVVVDPTATRTGRRGWGRLVRGIRPAPSRSWARDLTAERGGRWLAARRAVASVLILAAGGGITYAGVTAAPVIHIDPDVPVPAAMRGADWWPDYYRVAQWLNIPGEGHAYDPLGPIRLSDVRSDSINVVDGSRRTWTPPACTPCRRLTVWVYGGSTTFGIGQRDDFTIPSQLAKLAWHDGIALDVRNRGMPADMHWEEARRFAWDAASETPPDLVYFYDGTNEMWASMTLDSRGWGDDETQWNPETENARSTYRRLVDTQEGFFDPPQPDVEVDDERAQTSRRLAPDDLAQHVIGRYEKALTTSRATASAHRILTRWFWQPCLQSGRQVPGEPSAGKADLARNEALCRAATRRLPKQVIDLSTLYDGRTRPLFIDDFHTGEEGALIAAKAVYRELQPDLRALMAQHGA